MLAKSNFAFLADQVPFDPKSLEPFGTVPPVVIHGSEKDDLIHGTAGRDILTGAGGDDRLFGAAGEDTIDGGVGNDFIDGGAGNDQLIGGSGDDWIQDISGHNRLDGGDGNDLLAGGADRDEINGGNGNDLANGIGGDDLMHGNDGDDSFAGDDGNDVIYGDAGNDHLQGSFGSDVLHGGDGDDLLDNIQEAGSTESFYGENGDDRLCVASLGDALDNYAILDGGEGFDRLEFCTVGVITARIDLLAGKATGIEVIGLDYADDSRLIINPTDVFNFSAAHELYVTGGHGETVSDPLSNSVSSDSGDWTAAGLVHRDGITFQHYDAVVAGQHVGLNVDTVLHQADVAH